MSPSPARSRPGGVRHPQATSRVRAKAAAERTGPKFTGRAIVLLSVMVLLVGSYASALHAWWDQRSEVEATKAEISTRLDAIGDLENTKRRYDDPAFVERQARERFGWVMPGEVGYRVIGADGRIQGEVPAAADIPEVRVERWPDRLWASVEEAGRKPVTVPATLAPDKVLRSD